MPALKGSDIPARTVSRLQAAEAREGDLIVTCKRDDCDWQAIRPLHAAWSAADAHRLAHERGIIPEPQEASSS